jgi:hypothetical protein
VADGDQNTLANQSVDEVGNLIMMRRQGYLADQTATGALPFFDLVEIRRADMFTRMRATIALGPMCMLASGCQLVPEASRDMG